MSSLQWIGVGCVFVGLLCVLGSARGMWRRYVFLNHSVPAEGTVIDIKETVASWGKTREPTVRYTPTVRYQDASGQTHEHRLAATGDQKRFEVGAKVHLLYQANSPENVVDTTTGWQDVTTKLIASLLLVGLGVLLYSSIGTTPKP